MCSKSCFWFMSFLVVVLLGCCCCMGMKLGKYASKCGRCVFFGRQDEGCAGNPCSNEQSNNEQIQENMDDDQKAAL